jgi:hypothetical protein
MLSDIEIDSGTLEINDFDVRIYNSEVKNAFQKILHCIETDGDILSDGEVIDMIHSYLQAIHVE